MSVQEFLSSQLAFFYQRDPDDGYSFLNCVGLSDIQLSGREAGSPFECPDGRKGFKIMGFTPGSLVLPGFSAMMPFRDRNYLFTLTDEGKVNYRINAAQDGSDADEENYDIALIFVDAETVAPSMDGGKAMQSGDVSRNMTGVTVQATYGFELKPLDNYTRLTTTEDQQGTGVYFWPAIKSGLMRRRKGQYGVFTVQADAAATANVLFTDDYGSTITAGGSDPFDADEHAGHPLGVDLPQTYERRAIVFRTVTDGSNPAECAYSDDSGANWTTKDIGSTNGEFVTASLRVHDGLLLCGTDGGNVYYSKDKAVTWTAGSYGGSNDVRAFDVDPQTGRIWAVGDSSEIYYSDDNGETWASGGSGLSGDATRVAINYKGYIFVVDGTTLKYTKDEGSNWTTVSLPGTTTAINGMGFDPDYDYIMYVLHDDAGSDDVLLRSEDGGVSFIAQTTGSSNTGLNELFIVDKNLVYLSGDVVTTTWLEKVYGAGEGS